MNYWLARAAIGVALLAAVGAITWALRGTSPAEATPPPKPALEAAPRVAEAASTTSEVVTVPAPTSAAASPPLPSSTAASQPVASASQPLANDERIEVCGHGRLNAQDLERLYPQEVQFETRQRLIDALARGSDREQAIAWVLAGSLVADRAMAEARPICGEDAACMQRATMLRFWPATATVAGLTALAQRSRDPWVYAAAAGYGCRFAAAQAAMAGTGCESITPQGWQERAPEDAAAWLWQAQLAANRKNQTEVRAALHEAAQRPRMSSTVFSVEGELSGLPAWQSLKGLDRVTIAVDLVGRSAALPQDVLTPLSQCRTPDVQWPQQAATCDGLIRLYTSGRVTLIQQNIGTRMAELRGWSADALAPLLQSRWALQAFMPHAYSSESNLLGCASQVSIEKRIREIAEVGEVGHLRKAMEGSGKSFEQWAELGREQAAKRSRPASQPGP